MAPKEIYLKYVECLESKREYEKVVETCLKILKLFDGRLLRYISKKLVDCENKLSNKVDAEATSSLDT